MCLAIFSGENVHFQGNWPLRLDKIRFLGPIEELERGRKKEQRNFNDGAESGGVQVVYTRRKGGKPKSICKCDLRTLRREQRLVILM